MEKLIVKNINDKIFFRLKYRKYDNNVDTEFVNYALALCVRETFIIRLGLR